MIQEKRVTKRIIWKKQGGSVARECVSYLPEQVVEIPAVLYAPGEVIEPAIVAAGGETKNPGYIDDKAVIHPAVLFEAGEVMRAAVLATGNEIKVPAVMRDETPEEVFTRFLPIARQREQDKSAARAQAIADGVFPLPEEGMEFAGVCDEADDLPSHHEHYFNALEWDGANKRVNPSLPKCKSIAHEKRRAKREAEFAPFDSIIAKQIPGADAVAAEAQRQAIRDKYAVIQANIDAAASIDAIEAALP